jgi:hypothetical protein
LCRGKVVEEDKDSEACCDVVFVLPLDIANIVVVFVAAMVGLRVERNIRGRYCSQQTSTHTHTTISERLLVVASSQVQIKDIALMSPIGLEIPTEFLGYSWKSGYEPGETFLKSNHNHRYPAF